MESPNTYTQLVSGGGGGVGLTGVVAAIVFYQSFVSDGDIRFFQKVAMTNHPSRRQILYSI
jgi:hypothetical protein